MPNTVSELASRLAENAEAVCRHYLSSGRRAGAYWQAGDVRNTPGRSLYVRLHGPSTGKGAAGKWTDAASGEHGDLLGLIRAAQGFPDTVDVLDEARRFLGLVRPRIEVSSTASSSPTTSGSPGAARRLWTISKPIAGTLAETYLRARGVSLGRDGTEPLRFHSRCFYRAEPGSPDSARDAWPALVALVTAWDGERTGLQRIWLDPAGQTKAAVSTPRRAMEHLLGNAVRFGAARDVMLVGEGIETVLALRSALPTMPMAAALSTGHLAAFLPPSGLRRLYIARDHDEAGLRATDVLASRMQAAGIEAIVLTTTLGDFNDDLRQLRPGIFARTVRDQLAPEDVPRFWHVPGRPRPG